MKHFQNIFACVSLSCFTCVTCSIYVVQQMHDKSEFELEQSLAVENQQVESVHMKGRPHR